MHILSFLCPTSRLLVLVESGLVLFVVVVVVVVSAIVAIVAIVVVEMIADV